MSDNSTFYGAKAYAAVLEWKRNWVNIIIDQNGKRAMWVWIGKGSKGVWFTTWEYLLSVRPYGVKWRTDLKSKWADKIFTTPGNEERVFYPNGDCGLAVISIEEDWLEVSTDDPYDVGLDRARLKSIGWIRWRDGNGQVLIDLWCLRD